MIKQGLPSQPVRLVGFNSLPKAGDPIICVESEEAGEALVAQRALLLESENDRPDGPVGEVELHVLGVRSRENVRMQRVINKANLKGRDGTIRIPIIVKADADGSLSAVRDSLTSLGKNSRHDVVIDPVLEGIGEVTATDIQMAKESEAVIFVFGFKRIDQSILNLAEQLGVTIESNEIIYSLLDEAKDLFGSYLPAVPIEHVHGRGIVQAIFEVGTSDGGEKIAGMRVTEGNMYKDKGPIDSKDIKNIKVHFRVLRDGKKISPDGEVITASSLRHFKDLVDSVKRGEECGLGLSGFSNFAEGDIIECYSVEMKNGTL
jgi:translation initiation factor IF-2